MQMVRPAGYCYFMGCESSKCITYLKIVILVQEHVFSKNEKGNNRNGSGTSYI